MTQTISYLAGNPCFDEAAHTVLTERDFAEALAEISQWEGYAPTPLHSLADLAADIDVGAIHYKHEGPRFGLKSFKALGGAYAAQRLMRRELCEILGMEVSLAEVRNGTWPGEASKITLASATDGNHGRSLAWGCRRFGAPCRIYIHANVSAGRERAMQELGADVVRISGDYDESVVRCRQDADANGWFVVSDTSWPGYTETPRDVMAGYGVMLREVYDQERQPPTHVFVQGGVGGLAAATAASLRQLWGADSPRVVVVEPRLAPCLFESARQGRPAAVEIEDETIMAGLSCGEPSPLAWEILRSEASDFLVIDDSLIPPTIRRLARPSGNDPVIEAGESGVAGLAALIGAARSPDLREMLGLRADSRVLLIGSEGVTDPDIFAEIMNGG
jgi:diaminopropionate ammonia-lyase